MNKKGFIIIVCLLVLVIGGLTTLLIIKDKNSEKNVISEELKNAKKLFDLDLTTDGKEYIINNLKTAANYEGASIVIPDTIDSIPVTKIVDRELGFGKFNLISSITIGKNINYIGTSRATSVDEEKKYGEDIFLGASNLTWIEVHPENQVYTSENGVLYNKDKTVLLKYPNNKNNSSNQAIHTFQIPDSVIKVYSKAFCNNKSLEYVKLGSEVTLVGNYAFSNCTKLTKIDFNNKVIKIGSRAFDNCTSLSEVNLPNSLTTLGASVFNRCINLANVKMSSQIEVIGVSIFTGCNELTSILIEEAAYDNFINLLKESSNNKIIEKVSKILSTN